MRLPMRAAVQVGLEPVERRPRIALALRRDLASGSAGRVDPPGDQDAVALRDDGELVRQEVVEQDLAAGAAEGVAGSSKRSRSSSQVLHLSRIVEVLAVAHPS